MYTSQLHVQDEEKRISTLYLDNGYMVDVYVLLDEYPDGMKFADIAVVVGQSSEEMHNTFDALVNGVSFSTGDGTMKALVAVKDYILNELIPSLRVEGFSYLKVTPVDEKRYRAYRRLLKYGFVENDDSCSLFYYM